MQQEHEPSSPTPREGREDNFQSYLELRTEHLATQVEAPKVPMKGQLPAPPDLSESDP